LQKRADNHKWDNAAAGHFLKESYEQAAIRETKEELGIHIEKDDLKEVFYGKLKSEMPDKINYRFVKVFVVRKDISVSRFILDKTVEEISYFSKNELEKLFQTDEILSPVKYFYENGLKEEIEA